MPKGDHTGPMGAGAASGRKAGFCAGFDMPGYANKAVPFGAAMGMGRRNRRWCGPSAYGRGGRNRFFAGGGSEHLMFNSYPTAAASSSPEMNTDFLKHRSRILQSELDAIHKTLETLDSQKQEETS